VEYQPGVVAPQCRIEYRAIAGTRALIEGALATHVGGVSAYAWINRLVCRIESRCVDDGLLAEGKAPSYYLEGLLYNVPVDKFGTSYQDCCINAINWIQKEADKDKLVCANEQYYFLRDGSPTCWPKANGEAFLHAAIQLWSNW
jgi:hypothetical protein